VALEDVGPDGVGDLDRRAVEPAGAGHVEEGLVEGQRLDQRCVRAEHVHHAPADLAVVTVVPGQEHGPRAEPPRPDRGHGRVDAVHPCLVRGGGHDATVPGAPDDHWQPHELGTALQLAGHEERIHVDVEDRRLVGHRGHRRSTWRLWRSTPVTR
jgi:hypothetical protein